MTDELATFAVRLIPDENHGIERPLIVHDLGALMAEVEAILQDGDNPRIDEARYGSHLRLLDPLRAESERGVLVVWVGGGVGYAINPSGGGHPLRQGVMMSGTEHRGIVRLETHQRRAGPSFSADDEQGADLAPLSQ